MLCSCAITVVAWKNTWGVCHGEFALRCLHIFDTQIHGCVELSLGLALVHDLHVKEADRSEPLKWGGFK